VSAGATKSVVSDKHNTTREITKAYTDSLRIANIYAKVDQQADSTIHAVRVAERRSLDTLQAKSNEIVGLVNADVKAVGDGLHTFLQRNSQQLTENQRQQVYALMQQISVTDDSTSERTARLRTYIEDYATRSTDVIGRTLSELQTLTNPVSGVIPTASLRTAESRDSVVRAFDQRITLLESELTNTYGGISQSVADCKLNAEQLSPHFRRLASLVETLSRVQPAAVSVQAPQTPPDSGSASGEGQ
jgi:uncharacterized coiled-coil protein SlyX